MLEHGEEGMDGNKKVEILPVVETLVGFVSSSIILFVSINNETEEEFLCQLGKLKVQVCAGLFCQSL